MFDLADRNRSAYVVRVNIHNNGWDGTICTRPTQHDDCRAKEDFKSGNCAAGRPICFFLSLFRHDEPSVRLIKSQDPYRKVFARQRPERGDIALFWGTYSDGRNFPVGLWEVHSFDDESDASHYVVRGEPSTLVKFSPRTSDWATLDRQVSRAIGADMIRLLPADALYQVCSRWIADHDTELDRLQRLGMNTDDVRGALSGLQRLRGRLPEPQGEHLTHRPFADIRLAELVNLPSDVATEPPAPLLLREPETPVVGGARAHLAAFPESLVDDYRVALEVSPLVVLAGPTGSGKTRLTSAYAESVGAEYLLVPVRPDWRSNEDLLGYLPPFGEDFVATSFSQFVLTAAREWATSGTNSKRYHVCLDEMNLARPEYYLAEVLSRMELDGNARQLQLYEAQSDRGFPRSILLPPNLSIIGTVNNDDTTHALSPKVLDRAVYLNLDVIDLEAWFADRSEDLARWIGPHVVEIDARMAATGMRIGYRACRQVMHWVEHSMKYGNEGYAALDAALSTLVFTRLRVRRAEPRHTQMLDQLEAYLDKESADGGALFPRSTSAVRRLRERLERHEFAYGQFET